MVLALLLLACAPPERSSWECVAPANAGGGWDLTCRLFAAALQNQGLSPGAVRTTNRPGAGGGVAFANVVSQRSEDPRLLVAASPATTLRLAQEQYGALEVGDVRWVGAVGAEYGIVAVARDAPWTTLRSLMAEWGESPGSIIAAGGSPVLGQDHMKLLLLGQEAGVDPRQVRYVPFDGGGEAVVALLGGFVQVFSGEVSEVEAHVESGEMRILAVLSPDRLSGAFAAVPTARESGYQVEWVTWRGFYVPGSVPDSVYRRWVRVLETVSASDEWGRALQRSRLQPFFLMGEPFEAYVQDQVGQFREAATTLGVLER